MREFCKKLVAHRYFDRIVAVVIVTSGFQLGAETFPELHDLYGHLFDEINIAVMILYGIELAIRIISYDKPLKFFKEGWNVFDFLVIVLPLLPIDGPYQTFAKVIRVLRVVRLLKFIPEINLMIKVVNKSTRSILSISLLLGVFFYTYSVAGVVIFGENDHLHFRDLATSMLTMFRVVTLEGWTDIMYINMYGCDEFGYEVKQRLCTNPKGHPLEAAAYFVSFVTLGTMIILNLFIAVIVESVGALQGEAYEEHYQEQVSENKISELEAHLHDIELELGELTKKASLIRKAVSEKKVS